MSFFILTGAILLGTIFIAHFAANRMGFRLFYSSLFLSATLALGINLIVISMKEVKSPLSILKVLLAVLVSAAMVTVINDLLTRREKKKLLKKRKNRKDAAKRAGVAATEEVETKDDDDINDEFEDTSDKSTEDPKNALQTEETEAIGENLEKVDDITASNESEEVPRDTDGENFEQPSAIEENNVAEPEKTEEPKVANEEAPETPENQPAVQESEADKSVDNSVDSTDFSAFSTLDDILDYAYDARADKRYEDAVAAYNAAIERFEDDPYLPFLFIDLANVHKNQGEYDAAIDIYEKAVNMENIKKDADTFSSFNNNIAYLKRLKKVLRTRKIEHIPFNELGEDILKEVDEKA